MKKHLPYLLILIALSVAVTWFVKNPSKETINKQEGEFAVKDAKEIFKIVLTDTEKNKIELTNANGVWMVNGKYAAREDLIKQLMDAVTRVTSLTPVPSAAHDNVIREMLTHHVRAEVFDIKGNLLKSYLVGGPTVDGQNTYMLLETDGKAASRPHMTYIPGLRGYLTLRYSTDEVNWRTRVLYNYNADEIKSLRVEYPDAPQNSFAINSVAKDSFTVSPADEKFRIPNSYEQKYIKQYLSFYSSIFIEAFDSTNSNKDSVLDTTPYCIITITENDNSTNLVKLFRMPLNKRSKAQFDLEGKELNYDVDHFYASIHNGQDFAVVQYYVFGKLLRNYKDFFFKPAL
jgi:hypothetical protein